MFVSNMLIQFVCIWLVMLRRVSTVDVDNNVVAEISATNSVVVNECSSIDIRNECKNFHKLDNCTVITGYLLIVLLPLRHNNDIRCNFSEYRFPLLTEITDFFIFHEVRNITSIKQMFPNLTVIRGQRLFLNYALGITSMTDLKMLEFRSLIAIQRGHILVGNNPKLCQLETVSSKINWDRLTISPGENHIFPNSIEECIEKYNCSSCPTNYCWSEQICQYFENDNFLRSTKQNKVYNCSELCLGGCSTESASDCRVCKAWTDHGECVKECPTDKYANEHYLRCYTRKECLKKKGYIYRNKCVESCPAGFKLNKKNRECNACSVKEDCEKICNPSNPQHPFWIFNLDDVERLKGCQILNGSVFITIRNKINENDLMESFQDVAEIRGHLKVYKSPHITSLRFFKGLRKIHGQPLENDHYALILYNNKNLREIWNINYNLIMVRGGMFVHLNYKLCNRYLMEFAKKVIHDRSKDSLQTNDQEVLCAPAKMILDIQAISHRSLKFVWLREQTSDEIEIIYRPIPNGKKFFEDSELDAEICERINWRRELKFPSELVHNGTHYSYIVTGLESHMRYACLVKTFGRQDNYEARSSLIYETTEMNIPQPPLMKLLKKTDNSLTIFLNPGSIVEPQVINYYLLEIYHLVDTLEDLDQRDYCKAPIRIQEINDYEENYQDCCSRMEEDADDRLLERMLQQDFSCSRDRPEFCNLSQKRTDSKLIYSKRLEYSETIYTAKFLEHFHLYTIQARACNHFGCSSYSLLSERTNYSFVADKIYEVSACRLLSTNEYQVIFNEPPNPNGLITSYVITFRDYRPGSNGSHYRHYLKCISRREHSENNNRFKTVLSASYNQVAIRVNSLAGFLYTDWVYLNSCSTVHSNQTQTAQKAIIKGLNVFVAFFLLGALATMIWFIYKRRYWQKLPQLRRCLTWSTNWRNPFLNSDATEDDRQILINSFNSVRFQNNAVDGTKYLVH